MCTGMLQKPRPCSTLLLWTADAMNSSVAVTIGAGAVVLVAAHDVAVTVADRGLPLCRRGRAATATSTATAAAHCSLGLGLGLAELLDVLDCLVVLFEASRVLVLGHVLLVLLLQRICLVLVHLLFLWRELVPHVSELLGNLTKLARWQCASGLLHEEEVGTGWPLGFLGSTLAAQESGLRLVHAILLFRSSLQTQVLLPVCALRELLHVLFILSLPGSCLVHELPLALSPELPPALRQCCIVASRTLGPLLAHVEEEPRRWLLGEVCRREWQAAGHLRFGLAACFPVQAIDNGLELLVVGGLVEVIHSLVELLFCLCFLLQPIGPPLVVQLLPQFVELLLHRSRALHIWEASGNLHPLLLCEELEGSERSLGFILHELIFCEG
mmetsp:Transcript_33324/g.77414  ORF Transcript_33324/g.77414 Transcript_33324/m.77414 type:complete len:384 (+) Transcript_33324:35-1186(+)